MLFGDPYQLAPVPGDPEERAYFADTYRSMWFFDAKVWQSAELKIFELTEIHRQHDAGFKTMLNAVRYGQVTPEIGGALNGAGARTPPTEGVITLATRNDAVNRINAAALKRLSGKSLSAKAEVTGDFGGRTYPADEVLELKVGAQVMFLRNDNPLDGGPRWVNGTIGTVTRVDSTVYVDIDGTTHEVEPTVWEKFKYTYNAATKKLSKDVVAEFTQFPLAAGLGGHHPQVAGRHLRAGDRGPRHPGVQPRPDLCGPEPADQPERPLPHPAVAPERHHRRRERAAFHGGPARHAL